LIKKWNKIDFESKIFMVFIGKMNSQRIIKGRKMEMIMPKKRYYMKEVPLNSK